MTAPRLSETPDIEARIAATLRVHRTVVSGDVDGWHVVCASCGDLGLSADVDAHVAQALAPVLAAAVREAEQRALREAADVSERALDDLAATPGYSIWAQAIVLQDATKAVRGALNARADRIAGDATRTDQADEATKEDR